MLYSSFLPLVLAGAASASRRFDLFPPRVPAGGASAGMARFQKARKSKVWPIVNDYEVGDLLGDGTFGFIWKVTAKSNGDTFALKTITAVDELKNHLKQVRRQLLNFDHPNIAKMHDILDDCRKFYMIKELCSGLPLLERMVEENDKSPVAESRIAGLLKELLDAVGYMHEKGFLHGDIMPDCLMFANNDVDARIKILDVTFSHKCGDGAWVENSRDDSVNAREYAVQTSVYFCAPETLRRRFDPRCDVWSLGSVSYTLLSGCPPFHGLSEKEVLVRKEQGEVECIGPEWKSVSSSAKDLVAHMLQKNPDSRKKAREYLVNPWICAPGAGQVAPSVATILKEFTEETRSKQAGMEGLAREITNDQLRSLESVIPRGGRADGMWKEDDILAAFTECRVSIKKDDLTRALKMVDYEGSQEVDFEHFLAVVIHRKRHLQEEWMWPLFINRKNWCDVIATPDQFRDIINSSVIKSNVLHLEESDCWTSNNAALRDVFNDLRVACIDSLKAKPRPPRNASYRNLTYQMTVLRKNGADDDLIEQKRLERQALLEQTARERQRHKNNMAGHLKSHELLATLAKNLEPLSIETEGKSSKQMRAAASLLSSLIRKKAVEKALEERNERKAAKDAKVSQKRPRAVKEASPAEEPSSPRTPGRKPRKKRGQDELSGAKQQRARTRRASGANEGAAEEGREKKPKKPRAKTAFDFFKDDERPKFLEQNPSVKKCDFGRISAAMSDAWKNISEEAKRKYEKMAFEAKSTSED